MALNQTRIDRMVRLWNTLRLNDAVNDRAKALFFRNERRGYVRGNGGDQQFMADVTNYLTGINGPKAMTYIKLLRSFRREPDWNVLGYSILYFINGLDITTAQRSTLLAAGHAYNDRMGQPPTLSIVRKIAKDRGYESRRGRPSQTQMEAKRNILAQFIFDNWDTTIPTEVVEAMPHEMQAAYT